MVRDRSVSAKVFEAVVHIVMICVVLLTLLPVIHVISISFSSAAAISRGDVGLWPVEFSVSAYTAIFKSGNVPRSFLNSVYYTALGTAINMLLTTMMAYPLSRTYLTFRKFYNVLVLITMFFSGGLIPTFLTVKNLGLYNTVWAIVLPGAISTWNLIIMRTFFMGLPAELDSVPMPSGGNWGNAVMGMQIAYGVTNTKSYVDAWTGEFIPYGYTQDGFREALKWTNTFYKERFMDPEFATSNDNRRTEFFANGKAYIEYQYVESALWAETTMKPLFPDVDWEFTGYNISVDPSKGYLYQRDNTFFAYGYAFTDKISDEGLARMLDWCDYISTDEGATFMCMGVEGVTYQKNADGTLQFMDHMYHSTRNPEGTQPWKYGMYMGILRQTDDYTREVGKDANIVISADFNADSNAHYSQAFPTAYTPEQESRLATLDTQIGDMAEEYILKFIMSQLDPNDDNAWSQYLAALDNAGIQEASQIRIESYKKVSQ